MGYISPPSSYRVFRHRRLESSLLHVVAHTGWWGLGRGHVNVHELPATVFPSGPHLPGMRREASVSRGQSWPTLRLLCFSKPLPAGSTHLASMFPVSSLRRCNLIWNIHLPNNQSQEGALSWHTLPLWRSTWSPGSSPCPSSVFPLAVPHVLGRLSGCLGGRKMGFPGCRFLFIWSSSGQGSLF